MPPDRTALRRYTRWLPSLVLLVVCIAWWSPLGVIAALAAAVAVQSLLGRFDLVGDVLPAGGAKLQSAPLSPFARQPPTGDVTLGWAELGMGGPAYCTQMLRDGAIVGDIACDGGTAQRGTWTDLAGTSLRLASGYVDRSDGVFGYDEQRKVLLHFNVVPHVFWQTLGEHRQADGDVAAAAWVSRQPHVATALRGYHGLWLAPDDPALARPMQAQLCHRLPDGRELSARLLLPDDLRLKTANRLAAADLYKGVAWVHNPKLFYVGMQDQWFTFNMFDAQAWWVRDAIMGRIAIPADKAVLQKDVVDRVAGEDAGQDAHDAIHYQGDYVKELIAETDYPSFDVDGACEAFFEWKEHKKHDIMAFRNNAYKSVITGTMAPVHHTPWKDALEDSMESYLKN